jgi:hypothetical protein
MASKVSIFAPAKCQEFETHIADHAPNIGAVNSRPTKRSIAVQCSRRLAALNAGEWPGQHWHPDRPC